MNVLVLWVKEDQHLGVQFGKRGKLPSREHSYGSHGPFKLPEAQTRHFLVLMVCSIPKACFF